MDEPRVPLTPDEAKAALAMIEETTRQMRRMAAHGGTPYFILVWGIVWVLGFGAGHFVRDPNILSKIWLVLDVMGLLGTLYIVRRIRKSGIHWQSGATVGWFWMALVLYAGLFIYVTRPTGMLLSMVIALWAMFGYVVSGLFYRSRFLSTLGLVVTAFIVVGYIIFPAWFNLWMAILGGGSLVAAGLYILWAWR